MGAIDIPYGALSVSFLLLLIPLVFDWLYDLKLSGEIFKSTARMVVQLLLVGVFLKYLFAWNNPLLNVAWVFLMVLVAVFSALGSSALTVRTLVAPVMISFSLATFAIVFFLHMCVIRLPNIFDAQYLVVLSGMLLGNALRGNIVGITTFFSTVKKDAKQYLYVLGLGATQFEALLPYVRQSIQLALKPTIAAMATMGIVSLPGMMTGTILGGTSPMVAVKYQIMIMVGILAASVLSGVLTILMTIRSSFTPYGMLKNSIFVANSGTK